MAPRQTAVLSSARSYVRPAEVLVFFKKLSPCFASIQACGSSHYWARKIAGLGHDVRLIPPSYVKPFVKRGKTDAADAEAKCEAFIRKAMRFVPIKSANQQAAAMVLKTRELLVRQRTQAINALRAHLSELGIIAATGAGKATALIEIVRDGEDIRLPQGWRTFLRNHTQDIAAMDLFVVPTIGFDLLYAFIIVRLDRRERSGSASQHIRPRSGLRARSPKHSRGMKPRAT